MHLLQFAALSDSVNFMEQFLSLGLAPAVSEALEQLGCTEPTAVQRRAIPGILASRDLIMQSETGTGKTFAYLAPIFTRLIERAPHSSWPFAVIICPTQELAVQVARQAGRLAQAAGINAKCLALLGGTHFSRQKEELKAHPALITGTPGRLADLLRLSFFDMRHASFIVLDEADRLFASEYRDAVAYLLQRAPLHAIKILASATIPARTRNLAASWLKDPLVVDLAGEGILSEAIEHWVFYEQHRKKTALLKKLLSALRPSRCLIFAADSYRVQKTAALLQFAGYACGTIQARMEKSSRHHAIERFREGSLHYLVTTDLGARGLDIPDISHIISMDMPEEPSAYVHRAGRTGRAGRRGISILLADSVELQRASKTAVRYGFVFRTKWIEEGKVFEPPVEEFFQRVDALEAERQLRRHT